MKNVMLLPGQMVVKESEWKELQKIRAAHDAYLGAMRRMRTTQVAEGTRGTFAQGWWACLNTFATYIVEENDDQ